MTIYNKRNPPEGYYVYIYLRESSSPNGEAGTPYYVGKGKDARAWDRWGKAIKAPKTPNNILIHKAGLTEDEAFSEEERLIESYGRLDLGTGILRNKTDGGDGSSGHKVSGWKWTEESKAKRRGAGNPSYGKAPSEESIKKRVESWLATTGGKQNPDWVAKKAAARKGKGLGKKVPKEVIDRRTATLKENNKNRPKRTLTEAQKEHLRKVNTGKKQKPESIAKMLATKAAKKAQQTG